MIHRISSAVRRMSSAPRRLPRSMRLISLGAVTVLCACQANPNDPKWIDTTVEPPNQTVLWQVTIESLKKVRFPIGADFEPGKLRGVSGWDNELAPFKSEGYRERCHIEYTPTTGRRYAMKVRVERETNEDITHPLDLSYADWQPAPDNDARARLMVAQVKGQLGPEFRTTAKQTDDKKADDKPKPDHHD